MWQQQCAADQARAAANEAYVAQAAQIAELQDLERQRLELEHQREARELALAEAESDAARTNAAALRANGETERGVSAIGTADTKLIIFGGRDHRTFLGCLCDETDVDSVLNKYGAFGTRYSTGPSIWNRYGDYGSAYADTSACSPYANEPPIIVTQSGKAVGYITMNRYKLGAITDEALFDWLAKAVCASE